MQTEPFDRAVAFVPETVDSELMRNFKGDWNNENFRRSAMTWLTLFGLVILYPVTSIFGVDDPSALLRNLNDDLRMFLFLSTIVVQWLIFAVIFAASYVENTGLAGLGFRKLRWLDFFWAAALFATAALILSGLAELLAYLGMPMPGEIKFLIPQDAIGRFVWVFLSLTAAICEETAFRGYLMTRLRLIGGFNSWLIPTVVSALVFGACHAYQGIPGFIVISVYGAMFSVLFIYTRSIWPGIIAHFFQDLIALFIPQ